MKTPIEELELNLLGVESFMDYMTKLLSVHPLVAEGIALSHDTLSPRGSGFTYFVRNQALIMMASYFDYFMKKHLKMKKYRSVKALVEPATWGAFIEFICRRNCIVHNSARVDEDYLNCVPKSDLKIGDALITDYGYLASGKGVLLSVARTILQGKAREPTPNTEDVSR